MAIWGTTTKEDEVDLLNRGVVYLIDLLSTY